MLAVLIDLAVEVRLQSVAFHGMERIVQMCEMRGDDVVGKRMESFRLRNAVPLIASFPNMVKALNWAD